MTLRKRIGLGAAVIALSALSYGNIATADDSEDADAPRENMGQMGNFPTWNNSQNRNNCGYGINCARGQKRQEQEQERKKSRFSRGARQDRGSGGGGDDD